MSDVRQTAGGAARSVFAPPGPKVLQLFLKERKVERSKQKSLKCSDVGRLLFYTSGAQVKKEYNSSAAATVFNYNHLPIHLAHSGIDALIFLPFWPHWLLQPLCEPLTERAHPLAPCGRLDGC